MHLSVPNRTTPKNGAFDSRPASVKNWIEALPMANIGETTRLLFSAINELNHQDIPAQQRLKTLELLDKPTCYVTDNMKKHFVAQSLPMHISNIKIAHLSREVSQSLATGYKVLVMEQIAGIGRRDKKLLTSAIHCAVRHLGQALLKTYQIYEPCAANVWLELHSLYRYAEHNNLHRSKVAGNSHDEQATATVSDAYKRVLLLALACPYRLRRGEVEMVYEKLAEWAPFGDIQTIDGTPQALFAVNLDADQPPGYLVLREAAINRNSCRALNTRRLAEKVHQALTERIGVGARDKPGMLRESTLRRLMLAWGVMPKRRFSRVKDHSQVIVAMGLSSIHYFVSGEVVFNDAAIGADCHQQLGTRADLTLQQPAHFPARRTRNEIGNLPDVWEMSYRLEGDTSPTTTERAIARAAAGQHLDTSHITQSWKMINVSAGGYCMLWDNPETTRAQVGELLGIREESDPNTFHWRLAVIRWLKFEEKRGLELGVQMLSPGAVAIAARMDKKTRAAEDDYTRGLLLPEIASIQQRATLLMPSPPFSVGDTAIANCHGRDVRVKLTELVENTGSFAQFQFEALGEVQAPKRVTPTRPKDFDDIWELL